MERRNECWTNADCIMYFLGALVRVERDLLWSGRKSNKLMSAIISDCPQYSLFSGD
jgi:hypothetical protein